MTSRLTRRRGNDASQRFGGTRRAIVTTGGAIACFLLVLWVDKYSNIFDSAQEIQQELKLVSSTKTNSGVDYQVDEQCRNLPQIRPNGVFFLDPNILSHESPPDVSPSFHIGSTMRAVSSHMGGDVPHFKLIKELFEGQKWRQDEITFDIGANQGFFTYYLATLGMQVYSFEIDPKMFNSLQHGTLFNPKQVADRTNLYSMGLSEKVSRSGLSGGTYEGFLKENNQGTILTVPFDCFAHHLERDLSQGIAFVKLDVEGFEIAVLKGAHNSLYQHRIGGMLMEVGPNRWNRAQVDHVTGVEEMKRLAGRFENSHLLVRAQGSGFWKTCPPSLAETNLSDKSPRKLDHVFIYKVLPTEWEPLLDAMLKDGYDCNFWYTNS